MLVSILDLGLQHHLSRGSQNQSFISNFCFMCCQFSLQMDLIRQQLEFEAQQVQSVMEERFGTNDEMIQRTQVSPKGHTSV